MASEAERTDLCLCVTYLRATERAALAGARWLGRADQDSAEEAAFSGMRAAPRTSAATSATASPKPNCAG